MKDIDKIYKLVIIRDFVSRVINGIDINVDKVVVKQIIQKNKLIERLILDSVCSLDLGNLESKSEELLKDISKKLEVVELKQTKKQKPVEEQVVSTLEKQEVEEIKPVTVDTLNITKNIKVNAQKKSVPPKHMDKMDEIRNRLLNSDDSVVFEQNTK